MRVAIDGKEDLILFLRSIRYVIICIFGDDAFADSLVFTFHPTFDEDGLRLVHLREALGAKCMRTALDRACNFIDKSYIQVNVSVKPAFGE
jgi:hypothetical protein